MTEFGATLLAQQSAILRASAPWASILTNLDLGILLAAQPWLSRDGWKRAELERELTRLARNLPLGEIYFQRIRRAVHRLEGAGLLHGSGAGRSRRFSTSPEGFAALLLNLAYLQLDPTRDGSEFEFKRTLITLWTLLTDSSLELAGEVALDPAISSYFDAVSRVEILGRRVVTQESYDETMNLGNLVQRQRESVLALRARALETRFDHASEGSEESLRSLSGARIETSGFSDPAKLLSTHPVVQRVIRSVADTALGAATARASVLRYDAYLDYLDSLDRLHGERPSSHLRLFETTDTSSARSGSPHVL